MQEIRYSRAKMWLAAIFFGHAAVFLSVLIYDPQLAQPGRYGFLVQSALGHFVVLPLLTFLSAVVAISGAAVALGPGLAIVADSEGVSVTTVWRSHSRGLDRPSSCAAGSNDGSSEDLLFAQVRPMPGRHHFATAQRPGRS